MTSPTASTTSANGADGPPTVIGTLLRRDRARALVRGAFPRRRAQILSVRSRDELVGLLTRQLVDAVVLDAGAGEETLRAVSLAEEFPSLPFFLVTALLPGDMPLVARASECGVADVLVEGMDEPVVRDLVHRVAFSRRFERALETPPEPLGLATPLQHQVWRAIVRRGGRPVRTDELAREQGVSREHLSRTFAVGEGPTLKRVIDLVRVIAAAELAKNPGYDIRDVATVLGFASSSHLSGTTQRLVAARAASLTRLRTVDLVERFVEGRG